MNEATRLPVVSQAPSPDAPEASQKRPLRRGPRRAAEEVKALARGGAVRPRSRCERSQPYANQAIRTAKYESDDAHSHIIHGTGQRQAHPLRAERNWNGAVHNLRTSSAVSVSWPSLQPTQGEHNVMTNRCHKQQVCRPNGEARTLEYISAACASSCATQSSMLCLRTLPLVPSLSLVDAGLCEPEHTQWRGGGGDDQFLR